MTVFVFVCLNVSLCDSGGCMRMDVDDNGVGDGADREDGNLAENP